LLVSHDRDFLDRTVTSVIAPEGGGRWIEYAGGYSDMVAQRGHGVVTPKREKRPARRADKPATRTASAAEPRKRLSPTEQHVLKTAPARIDALSEQIRKLEHLLADPDFYAHDRSGFAAAGAELAKLQAELVAAEEDWLRLEVLRQEIEGA